MEDKEKFENICDFTTVALGLPKGVLSSNSRKFKISLGRQIASVIGFNKGVKRELMASIMNTNRTSTYYYTKEHESKFNSCIVYAKGYTKTLFSYEKIKPNTKVFLEELWLIKHLKKNGLKESINPEIIFTLTSGKIKHHFKSDCFAFSNDYDNIKKAIKGYNCKLKWFNIKTN
jgi:hypothetical protein